MLNDSFSPKKPGGSFVQETGLVEESEGEGRAQYEKFRNISFSSSKIAQNMRPENSTRIQKKQNKRFMGSIASLQNNQGKKKNR